MGWVVNPLPQHLIAAANADDRRFLPQCLLYASFHAALPQPLHIFHGVFTARQENQIVCRQVLSILYVGNTGIFFSIQTVKIGKVGNFRQLNRRFGKAVPAYLPGRPNLHHRFPADLYRE